MQSFDNEMQGNSYLLLKTVGERERADKILKLSKMTNIFAVYSLLQIPLESSTEQNRSLCHVRKERARNNQLNQLQKES